MKLLVVLQCLILCSMAGRLTTQTALPTQISIGAIVENGDESHINILRRAIERINRGNMFHNVELKLEYFIVKPNDSFQAAKICKDIIITNKQTYV